MIAVSSVGAIASGVARAVQDVALRGPSAGQAPAPDAGFGAILTDVANSATQSLKSAESVSIEAMSGKATARDVVETLMRAEQNLQVALALRDKAISAFQEISRMAI